MVCFGLVGGHGFELPLCNLNIYSHLCIWKSIMDFVCIDLFVSPHVGMGLQVREGVKDIKPKFYKIELFEKLVI